MIARLVECSDYDIQYGILTVENVSEKEVQDKIYEIKKRFHDKGFDEWCVDDVLAELPNEWDWGFTQANNIIEI